MGNINLEEDGKDQSSCRCQIVFTSESLFSCHLTQSSFFSLHLSFLFFPVHSFCFSYRKQRCVCVCVQQLYYFIQSDSLGSLCDPQQDYYIWCVLEILLSVIGTSHTSFHSMTGSKNIYTLCYDDCICVLSDPKQQKQLSYRNSVSAQMIQQHLHTHTPTCRHTHI